MAAARTQLYHFCILSLSRALCLDGWVQPYYMLVTQAGKLGATESAPAAEILPSPMTTTELWAESAAPLSALLPSLLPCLSLFTHLWMFRWADLSDTFVFCTGNRLLNYSCSFCCNFKWRDQGKPSHCHASDITPIFFSVIEIASSMTSDQLITCYCIIFYRIIIFV